MFPQKIFSLNYFKEVMEKLSEKGGSWSWIPVNDPDERYQTLWGGTLPVFGRPNYEKMDYEMHYPSDDDVKF